VVNNQLRQSRVVCGALLAFTKNNDSSSDEKADDHNASHGNAHHGASAEAR
jgi:hypothetical protein